MFYSDAGLPTPNHDNRIIHNITHTNTFLHSLNDTVRSEDAVAVESGAADESK